MRRGVLSSFLAMRGLDCVECLELSYFFLTIVNLSGFLAREILEE